MCRRRIGGAVPRAENVGDLITADHKVLSESCESRNNHRYAIVVRDLATQWIQSYPCKTKTSQETQWSLQKFLEPDRKHKVIYTDDSLSFGKACEDLFWNQWTSTPHRSETNAIAERAVRRVKEGTSAVLLQSGLNENWRAYSMECWAFLRKVQDLLSDGKTPYETRFGKPLKEPNIPFSSLVEYHPISAKDQARIHQFGKKSLPGLFLGYALYAEWMWKGDILVADLEEMETMDASEIYSKRLTAKKVIFPKKNGKFISSRRWTNQTPWRRSGPENIHLDTGTSNSRRRSRRFSWRISRVSSTTSWLISGCRWSDEWLLVHDGKLHIPPSLWTQSQTLLAERRIIPYSTEIHWRLQNYTHKLGFYARTPHRWLLEHPCVKRFVWLLDRFQSIYSIGRETSRRIYVVREETDKKAANIQTRSFMARTLDEIGKKCPAEGEAKVVTWKAKTR